MNQSSLQQSIQMQAQAQAQQQQMMMNQNNMQGQVARSIPQQPAQQSFHHLQHQMQASPIPGQQPSQLPMGMPNESMAQNVTPNQHQQFQISMQQQQAQQHQQQQQVQQQQPQNVSGRSQNQQPSMSAADAAIVNELTNRLMASSSPEEKAQIRMNMQNRMDPVTVQKYQTQGLDPIILFYRNQAIQRLRSDKNARAQTQSQAQQLNVSQQQPQNIPTTAPPMQQQRSMNPSPLNGQTQPPTSIGGNQDFGFIGNMGNLIDQQQQGVMAQEAGQMVVPASAQRNATPQPGMPGQQMSMNDQRNIANPNVRAQQQQQMFNVQQAQQQRMQHAAQQQSQNAARVNAHAKAQQMGLQGQPGGMGPGPMPPQQSPAMTTLNTPLRTPSQQMNPPEPPQMNANGQFGQPLDPRFMQGNQRPVIGPVTGFNPAMIAAMPQEQQQRLAGLPPEKLAEVVNRWNEQRAQHMNAANAQSGRPPIPVQGNNQFRPGQQVPQANQFNPQNALNQFMMANPGQRPPPALAAGASTPQQMMFQQQMTRLNPGQQRNPPQTMTPSEQRQMMQIDGMDFPPALLNHAHMPRGIPGEIKKWGALKQWAQQDANVGPEAYENIKGLQRLYYQQMLRARNQQAGQPQPMGVPTGGQGGPATAAMVPPGMSAPVAPMGQNLVQLQNSMNVGPGQIRQPSMQEIQATRAHPSGKMINASDDQIRTFLIRNQMTQRQSLLQQQQQLQMTNQLSLMNGQQPRPPMPGQTGNPMVTPQNATAQMTQPKAQPPPEPALPTPAINTGRSNRAAPNGRPATQASSPAPTPKNLKRASSDDVIEVPNPNMQPQRSASQQNQPPKPGPQQGRASMTPQQVAQLDPESRKKYDTALRMFQATQQASREQPNMAKLKAIMEEEQTRAREPLPDIPQDQETRMKIASMLRDIPSSLNNMMKAIPKWYAMTRDDTRARDYFYTVR